MKITKSLKATIPFCHASLFIAGLVLTGSVYAATGETVKISEGWVRATNPGQPVGAAYMTLTSQENVQLTTVKGNISANIEIHNMRIENGVMKMRMLDTLALPAKTAVQLAPGGLHIMLFDLKTPLLVGQEIPLTLHFNKTVNGKATKNSFTQRVVLRVKTSADDTSSDTDHDHNNTHEHHGHDDHSNHQH